MTIDVFGRDPVEAGLILFPPPPKFVERVFDRGIKTLLKENEKKIFSKFTSFHFTFSTYLRDAVAPTPPLSPTTSNIVENPVPLDDVRCVAWLPLDLAVVVDVVTVVNVEDGSVVADERLRNKFIFPTVAG